MAIELVEIYVPAVLKFRMMAGNYANVLFSDLYIPALQKELDRLAGALTKTDKLINSSLAAVEVILNTDEISGYLKALKKASVAKNEEAVAEFSAELKRSIEHVNKELVVIMKALSAQIDNLETVKISENDVEYRALDKRRSDFMKKLPEDKEAMTLIKEKRDQLAAAMLEYESKTFIDRAMPIIDVLKENVGTALDDGGALISKSGGATPLAAKQAIKAGMDVASKVLNVINEEIKYQQLVIAKDRLDGEINIRQKQMSVQEQEIDEIDDKRAQLMAIRELVAPRKAYVAEARKIPHMLITYVNEVFGRDLSVVDELMQVGEDFIKVSPGLSKYVNNLQFYWLRTG
ncbi:alpha-xenorhabdolysin family binary toxin subunit B [Pseudomonas sp. NPDC087346]|uniref:alpha-xenorhabdolysin family binary toxin subunit B n=1 Tax=Pseudomonas sp. NPDC087346 TaxID=3364438 RepID=UPI0037F49535